MSTDINQFASSIFDAVREHVNDALAGVTSKFAEIEERIKAIPVPRDGKDGKDVDPSIVESLASDLREAKALAIGATRDAFNAQGDLATAKQTLDATKREFEIASEKIKAFRMAPIAFAIDEAGDLLGTTLEGEVKTLGRVRGQDGENGKSIDPELIVLEAARRLTEMVDRAQAVLAERLEAAIAEIPPPEKGEAGKDADPAIIVQAVREAIAQIPVPKDGEPGNDAVVDWDKIESRLKEMGRETLDVLAKKVEAIPTPKDGENGKDAVAPELLIDHEGNLQAIRADGTTKNCGLVRGARGASLMDGSIDDAGQLILRMSDGRIVNAGMVRAKDGEQGSPGDKGEPGRDATELRILPSIDESRSYPENTCAAYRGGLIRAHRDTTPIEGDIVAAGWRVILDGIAEETERELDEGRVIERITIYTSGKAFARKIETAALIYRGVWRERDFQGCERTYQRGDVATFDGSLWHCEKSTTEKPGSSDGWKLCVKRGQPGKDAAPKGPF